MATFVQCTHKCDKRYLSWNSLLCSDCTFVSAEERLGHVLVLLSLQNTRYTSVVVYSMNGNWINKRYRRLLGSEHRRAVVECDGKVAVLLRVKSNARVSVQPGAARGSRLCAKHVRTTINAPCAEDYHRQSFSSNHINKIKTSTHIF